MIKEYLEILLQYIYKNIGFLKSSKDKIVSIKLNSNVSFKIKCNPSRGYIDIRLIWDKIYERNITNLFLIELTRNCIFIDIGANIGYYTLLVSRILDSKSFIHSFEPISETYNILIENIELNNIENVKAYKIALGSEDKKEIIMLSKEAGLNSIVSNRKIRENKIQEEIEIKMLDNLLDYKNRDLFFKIDIEGYEYEALKGMKHLLINNKCKIIFEFTPKFFKYFIKDTTIYAFEMFNFLNELGYVLFDVDKWGNKIKIYDLSIYIKNSKYKQKHVYAIN